MHQSLFTCFLYFYIDSCLDAFVLRTVLAVPYSKMFGKKNLLTVVRVFFFSYSVRKEEEIFQ